MTVTVTLNTPQLFLKFIIERLNCDQGPEEGRLGGGAVEEEEEEEIKFWGRLWYTAGGGT